MNAREEWLAMRRTGIGGSDIAAIMGLSPWRSAVDVYLDKIGETKDTGENEAMFWGNVLEDVVARHYATKTGAKVQRIGTMMQHPSKPWMLGNIDRAIVTPGSRARFDGGKLLGADGILECKTAGAFKAADWGNENDQDAIPTHYAAQCFWYMGVTGMEWCDIAVLIGGQRYLSKRIERDDEVIRAMEDRAEEFWHRHVLARIPPEPTSGSDAVKLFPRDFGTSIIANPKTLELLSRAQELKQQIEALELELDGDRKKGINGVIGELKAWMGGAAEITLGGQTLATWRAANDSQKTDWKSVVDHLRQTYAGEQTFADDLLAAITTNTTTQPGSRRFLIKG